MKKLLLYILLVLLPSISFAHDSNKSFFKIEQKETTVEVSAEFSWSIRNALLEYTPNLKTSKSKKEFDDAFFNYVKSTFLLIDQNGTHLELLSIDIINNGGHSHQNDFLFTFKGTSFEEISNSISFNLKNEHINHHTIINRYESKSFDTTANNPTFSKCNQSNATLGFMWLLLLIPIGLGVFIKKNKNYKI